MICTMNVWIFDERFSIQSMFDHCEMNVLLLSNNAKLFLWSFFIWYVHLMCYECSFNVLRMFDYYLMNVFLFFAFVGEYSFAGETQGRKIFFKFSLQFYLIIEVNLVILPLGGVLNSYKEIKV